MQNVEYIPWVEKYRPINFEDIVLDESNYNILKNILEFNYFPNMLFYGPPGIGKTTTIINVINKYQENNNLNKRGQMIHLNASDERGIDIIRYQINNFVNSKGFFENGVKFIILDEIDYMTKNAQQALKYLVQAYNFNIRFCLICNYISKVDESLQNEFVKFRFSYLENKNIYNFLNKINNKEKLNLDSEKIINIINYYKNDIRSMINYMQCNSISELKILTSKNYLKLIELLKNKNKNEYINYIYYLSKEYRISIKNIIHNFLNYVIRNNMINLNEKIINNIEYLIHYSESNLDLIINYLYYCIF
jgi:replication factor C subunit 3/5